MELKIGSTEKVNFSLFKKRFLFESGDRGLVLEQADGVVCLYATDAAHEKKTMELCESTDAGAMTLTDYALTKGWSIA